MGDLRGGPMTSFLVIPAKAGIPLVRPRSKKRSGIPAFAGMTAGGEIR
jgi:hypothetical protein